MSDNKLQKRGPTSIKEKGQYFLAFGVVASMLLVAGFPVFVIFFFGIFAYFLVRMFAAGSRNETKEIFEFYLSANEILRDDERKWFGFEIKDAILRGETVLQRMSGAPPLVYFTLGALYNKAGDHQAAVNCLSYVVEDETSDESTYAYPSPELRNYVRVLRRFERDPSDAPLTSTAVRALERARKLRGKTLLDDSRLKAALAGAKEVKREKLNGKVKHTRTENHFQDSSHRSMTTDDWQNVNGNSIRSVTDVSASTDRREKKDSRKDDPFRDHKPISEVLHEIYDKNI